MDLLACRMLTDQQEVVRRISAARKRLGPGDRTDQEVINSLTDAERREVISSQLRVSFFEVLGRALDQMRSMVQELEAIVEQCRKQGIPIGPLEEARQLAQRHMAETLVAATALAEHQVIWMQQRRAGPEAFQAWWKTNASTWHARENVLIGHLWDLLRCETGLYRNEHRVPPAYGALLDHLQTQYTHLFREANTEGGKKRIEALKKEGAAVIVKLSEWTEKTNTYHVRMSSLAITRHHILQAAQGDAGRSPTDAITDEAELKQLRQYMDDQGRNSLSNLSEHLTLVESGVLARGLNIHAEHFWNTVGRGALDTAMDMLVRIITAPIPTGIARGAVRSTIEGIFPPLLDWPKDDHGRDIPFDAIPEGPVKERLRKRLDSMLQAVRDFDTSRVLPKFRDSIGIMQYLRVHENPETLLSIMQEGPSKEDEEFLEKTRKAHPRLSEKSVAALFAEERGNPRHRALITLLCIEQFEQDSEAYQKQYADLLRRLHDILGVHVELGQNTFWWLKYAAIAAGVSWFLGGRGGFAGTRGGFGAWRTPGGRMPMLSIGRIINGPASLVDRGGRLIFGRDVRGMLDPARPVETAAATLRPAAEILKDAEALRGNFLTEIRNAARGTTNVERYLGCQTRAQTLFRQLADFEGQLGTRRELQTLRAMRMELMQNYLAEIRPFLSSSSSAQLDDFFRLLAGPQRERVLTAIWNAHLADDIAVKTSLLTEAGVHRNTVRFLTDSGVAGKEIRTTVSRAMLRRLAQAAGTSLEANSYLRQLAALRTDAARTAFIRGERPAASAAPTARPSTPSRLSRSARFVGRWSMRALGAFGTVVGGVELAGHIKEFASLTAGERRARLENEISAALVSPTFRRGEAPHTWVHSSGTILNLAPLLDISDADLMAVTIDMVASGGSIAGGVITCLASKHPASFAVMVATMIITAPIRYVTSELRANNLLDCMLDIPPMLSAHLPISTIVNLPYEEIHKRLNDARGMTEAGGRGPRPRTPDTGREGANNDARRMLSFSMVAQEFRRMSPVPLSLLDRPFGRPPINWIDRLFQDRATLVVLNALNTAERDPSNADRLVLGARRLASITLRRYMAIDYADIRALLQAREKERATIATPAALAVFDRQTTDLRARMELIGAQFYADGLTVADVVTTGALTVGGWGNDIASRTTTATGARRLDLQPGTESIVPHEFASVLEREGALRLQLSGATEELRHGIPCFVLAGQGPGGKDVLFAMISGRWYVRIEDIDTRWNSHSPRLADNPRSAALAVSVFLSQLESRTDPDLQVRNYLTDPRNGFTQETREGRSVYVKAIPRFSRQLIIANINGAWLYRSPMNPSTWLHVSDSPPRRIAETSTDRELTSDGELSSAYWAIRGAANARDGARREGEQADLSSELSRFVLGSLDSRRAGTLHRDDGLRGVLDVEPLVFSDSTPARREPGEGLQGHYDDAMDHLADALLNVRSEGARFLFFRHVRDMPMSGVYAVGNCEVIFCTAVYGDRTSGNSLRMAAVRTQGSSGPFVPLSGMGGAIKQDTEAAQKLFKEQEETERKEKIEGISKTLGPAGRLYSLARQRADIEPGYSPYGLRDLPSVVVQDSPLQIAIVEGDSLFVFTFSDPPHMQIIDRRPFFSSEGSEKLTKEEELDRRIHRIRSPDPILRGLSKTQMERAEKLLSVVQDPAAIRIPINIEAYPNVTRALANTPIPLEQTVSSILTLLGIPEREDLGDYISHFCSAQLAEVGATNNAFAHMRFIAAARLTLERDAAAIGGVGVSQIRLFNTFMTGNLATVGGLRPAATPGR